MLVLAIIIRMEKQILEKIDLINRFINDLNSLEYGKIDRYLSKDITLKNISHGEIVDTIEGKEQLDFFLQQRKNFFKEHYSSIDNIHLGDNSANIDLTFTLTLAMGTPEGLRAGEKITFKGSISLYFKDNKIVKIDLIS